MYLDKEHNMHHIFQNNIKQINAALGLIKQFQVLLKSNVCHIIIFNLFQLSEFQQPLIYQDNKNNIVHLLNGI